VEKKADGSFYTQAELAGAGAQAIIGSLPLAEQTFIGVVQQSGESGGLVATNKADQGGQIFQFNVSEYLLPDTSVTPILGGDSADSFAIGTNITNLLITKAGNDSVNVSSGQGGNRIFTNLGDDDIITGSGDRVYAGQGNDTITATASTGGGRFAGENGDDDFLLGSGDRVLGGNGNDKFFVGAGGGNTITGGQGTDQFWIANGQVPTAANTITDFSAGEDVLGIQGLGVTDVSQLTLSGSTIRFNSRDLATLTGVTVSTLTNANFAFA
jgi:Ca2+-binding RTX toxin-like protein